MPTVIPKCPSVPASRSSRMTARELEISVITPLFGGGVEAGSTDISMPIRATSIRGQLQFWWRATRGAVFNTYEELFAKHSEIWGTTDRSSQVEVEICNVATGRTQRCARHKKNDRDRWFIEWNPIFGNTSVLYALFPFQGEPPNVRSAEPSKEPAEFIPHAKFQIRLRYPKKLHDDVEAAVRAWVNFGGLGARTRRGCGALLCKEFAPHDREAIAGWFKAGALQRTEGARPWATMPSHLWVGQEMSRERAWSAVIGDLQTFRQGKGVGRNSGKQHNRPGRSRFPEPETIRRITRQRFREHQALDYFPDAFPRAEFGLPIVFHFKDDRNGDPKDTFLYPASSGKKSFERMASPLILKPLALANGKAVPLILRLNTEPLTSVELRGKLGPLPLSNPTTIRGSTLQSYHNSPLEKSPTGSAIEAFIAHATASKYQEIKR